MPYGNGCKFFVFKFLLKDGVERSVVYFQALDFILTMLIGQPDLLRLNTQLGSKKTSNPVQPSRPCLVASEALVPGIVAKINLLRVH